ncbi:error-prone DNA polymerase [Brevundimonas sp.]|uniref:error-prone DNA polymerase n=1 Tax=Brevundimonas sp. TaxID=1871086 RepID=UPI003D0E306C
MSAWSGEYAELGAMTNFSFLEGASHPGEMMMQAKALGLAAVGIADRNTLAGIVRALMGAEDYDIRLVVGVRLGFLDGTELIVFPRDRAAYGRLCRLLTLGKSEILDDAPPHSPHPHLRLVQPVEDDDARPDRTAKGDTRLTFDQAVAHGAGLIALAVAPEVPDAAFEARLLAWRRAWPDTLYLAAAPLWRGDDRARLNRLAGMANRTGAPMIATNAAMYHHPDRRPMQDVLTCIREGTTIDKAGLRLQVNGERSLKPAVEMARLFRGHEAALDRTMEVVRGCSFSLRELSYQYPDEPVPPGWSPQGWLIRLTCKGAREKWPRDQGPVPAHVVRTIRKELRLVRERGYAPYFLTVHEVVAWARHPDRNILCQGRGSAANSVICFCLGITNVNPTSQDMLIERFISSNRSEPPDIDVDFEHERRELVMQHVYERYGRDRAGIVATIIHYRPRSAIRDVGKALGLTDDVTARMADTVWGSFGDAVKDDHVDRTGLDRDDVRMDLALRLTAELIKFPRHLSQHVGGFVLSQGPLVEIVPIGNAAMPDRTFIEWDKDDIDHLNLMKVDVLALGMLTAMKRAFRMIGESYDHQLALDTVPTERPEVYDMLCKGDSLGVFQVESRAQMAMLPRLRPRVFYDLVVQVAIVRPGPIQGDMVHPYLKRRTERRAHEAVHGRGSYRFEMPGSRADPLELTNVLRKTLGVPLFQEQAMKIAMVAAEFSGEQANGLRRAMATFRHMGTIGEYEVLMVDGMIRRGYDPDFAQKCFNQIKGFGEYGFPESHACSFAFLVYISAWVKCFYPDVFAACLLNSQPMGFYAPAQIVRDAREHGVEVRHPDLNASDWDATLEPGRTSEQRAMRLGLRSIDGFKKDWALKVMAERALAPFRDLEDLRIRADLPPSALDRLAEADAYGSLDLSRRQGMWAAKGAAPASSAPLFAAMGLDEADGSPPAALPRLTDAEEVVGDYQTIRLSLKGHPVAFLRERLTKAGAVTAEACRSVKDGRRVRVGGVVLVRQRPGSAKGVVFLTLEDETAVANLVVWPDVFERLRPVAMGARMVLAVGKIQRSEEGVTHLVVEDLIDWTPMLGHLSTDPTPGSGHAPTRGRHPRDVRILPGSRDFH